MAQSPPVLTAYTGNQGTNWIIVQLPNLDVAVSYGKPVAFVDKLNKKAIATYTSKPTSTTHRNHFLSMRGFTGKNTEYLQHEAFAQALDGALRSTL